jgi:hypothetical protein
LLTAAGAILGLWGGTVLIAWLRGIVPAWIPIPGSAATIEALHGVSDRFTLSAGAAAAVLMGTLLLVPSLWHLRSGSWQRANASERTRDAGWRRGAQRLVAVELVLATVLLIFAGLLVRTANHLLAVDPGVEPRGLLTMYVGQLQEPRPEARACYFMDVVREVERVPGVSRVGVSDYVPFQGEDDFMGFRLPDRPRRRRGKVCARNGAVSAAKPSNVSRRAIQFVSCPSPSLLFRSCRFMAPSDDHESNQSSSSQSPSCKDRTGAARAWRALGPGP